MRPPIGQTLICFMSLLFTENTYLLVNFSSNFLNISESINWCGLYFCVFFQGSAALRSRPAVVILLEAPENFRKYI